MSGQKAFLRLTVIGMPKGTEMTAVLRRKLCRRLRTLHHIAAGIGILHQKCRDKRISCAQCVHQFGCIGGGLFIDRASV